MVDALFCPKRGDVIWLDFSPYVGHEQGGRRPAAVLSPSVYNRRTGLAIVCPVTTRAKGHAFELAIPEGLPAHGVILCDHVRNCDWRARNAEHICDLPLETMVAAIDLTTSLIDLDAEENP
jgi:mRNA interferase MazF